MIGYILLLVVSAFLAARITWWLDGLLAPRPWRLMVTGIVLAWVGAILWTMSGAISGVSDRATTVGGVLVVIWLFAVWYRSARKLHAELMGAEHPDGAGSDG